MAFEILGGLARTAYKVCCSLHDARHPLPAKWPSATFAFETQQMSPGFSIVELPPLHLSLINCKPHPNQALDWVRGQYVAAIPRGRFQKFTPRNAETTWIGVHSAIPIFRKSPFRNHYLPSTRRFCSWEPLPAVSAKRIPGMGSSCHSNCLLSTQKSEVISFPGGLPAPELFLIALI
ncbi:MAG: hypothetical protein IPL28_26755 [Chloroflexi bacterium]|nr:hypothetical protein [Chloroflexota bacterium]